MIEEELHVDSSDVAMGRLVDGKVDPPGGPVTSTSFPVAGEIHLVLRYPRDWQLSDDNVRTLLRLCEVFAGVLATVHAKERHYAGAWRDQGWRGNLARVLSKTSRLRNMLWRSDPIEGSGEPAQDTLQDLISLTAFTILNRQARNEWGRNDETRM